MRTGIFRREPTRDVAQRSMLVAESHEQVGHGIGVDWNSCANDDQIAVTLTRNRAELDGTM